MKSFKSFLEDVRKMPMVVMAFMLTNLKIKKSVDAKNKHAKELKKVYKNKKDANDYMKTFRHLDN